MVARGPGAVGCAHCTMIGAEVACIVCKRLVCAPCAADWATCSEPSGRTFRMGTTARLIDVDPSGRFGLVARWWGPLKVVDLRALCWVKRRLPGRGSHPFTPRITTDGRVLKPQFNGTATRDLPLFDGIGVWSPGDAGVLRKRGLPVPARCMGLAADDRYSYVTDTELVAIVRFDRVTRTDVFEPLPKKVVQHAYVDGSRDLLVSATWGEIAIHRIVDRRLELLGHLKTTGDMAWLALGGKYLAVRVTAGAMRGLTVWRLDEDFSIASVALRMEEHMGAAALSRDGRYLAVASPFGVTVRGVETGSSELLEGHTDRISLVRFVGDDDVLVYADEDNRVIMRPRQHMSYATPVLPVDLAV